MRDCSISVNPIAVFWLLFHQLICLTMQTRWTRKLELGKGYAPDGQVWPVDSPVTTHCVYCKANLPT